MGAEVVSSKEEKKSDDYLEDEDVKWDLGLEEKATGNGSKESAEESPKSDQKILFRMSMSDFEVEQLPRESNGHNAIVEEGKVGNKEEESEEDKKAGNKNTNNAVDI